MDKSIIITGCSSGIGLCAALTLHARGYRIFATARKTQDVMFLQQQGFDAVQLDLNDSTSIQAAVADIDRRTAGNIYGLINNAGYGQAGAVEDLSRAALRQQFETNVFGLQELTNLIIPWMRTKGSGRIINVSSLLGMVSMPYRGAYNASKYALEGLTDALRLELRGSGIFVVLIEPGPIVSHFRDTVLANVGSLNIDSSVHRHSYQQMIANTQAKKNAEPFTKPPEAVVKKMVHALESPKPKLRYYVTVPTYVLTTFKRFLPSKVFDWLMIKISENELKN